MNQQAILFDARGLRPDEAQARALSSFDDLVPGRAMVLVDEQDASWLLSLLHRHRSHQFDWSPLEEGPARWRVRVDRRDRNAPRLRGVMEYLAWDHDRLDATLQDARERAGSGDWKGAMSRFIEFRHGLLRHIRMEEDVLFPAFEVRSGMAEEGPTAVMRAEHREIKAILLRLPDAIENGALEPFEAEVASLLAVLGDHNTKEEEVLYPMTDRMHDENERDELVRTMQGTHGVAQ